jgi:hypothetical protein
MSRFQLEGERGSAMAVKIAFTSADVKLAFTDEVSSHLRHAFAKLEINFASSWRGSWSPRIVSGSGRLSSRAA